MRVLILSLLVAGLFILSGTPLALAAVSGADDKKEQVRENHAENQVTTDFDADFDADFDEDFTTVVNSDSLISDPLQPFNRAMFWFNDKMYFYFFKPVAKGLTFVLPRPVRVSVRNFFINLETPVRAGNALLQLKFNSFGTEVYRFAINSTIGIAGLFDPADSWLGVKRDKEDFGQTLGHYNVGHGFYLILPFVGPSSLRDGFGLYADTFLDPVRYVSMKPREYFAVKYVDVENRLSLDNNTYEGIVAETLDPYLFIRAAYVQRRAAQVGGETFDINVLFDRPLLNYEIFSLFNLFGP